MMAEVLQASDFIQPEDFQPRGGTSHTSSGATLYHENKTAKQGPVPVENLESLALFLSYSRLNFYLIGKVLQGTETHP